jgi:cobalt/nickel transport system permease protein
MPHIHIPDGILPVWIWVLGFIIMSLAVGCSLFWFRTVEMKEKIPLFSALSATMLVGMSLSTGRSRDSSTGLAPNLFHFSIRTIRQE